MTRTRGRSRNLSVAEAGAGNLKNGRLRQPWYVGRFCRFLFFTNRICFYAQENIIAVAATNNLFLFQEK